MSAELNERKVSDTLRTIIAEGKSLNIVEAGQVSGIVIKDGHVGFTIEIDPADKDRADGLRTAAEKAVRALDGVLSATAMLTAHQTAGAGARGGAGGHSHDHSNGAAGGHSRAGGPGPGGRARIARRDGHTADSTGASSDPNIVPVRSRSADTSCRWQ